jgi:hypothetical protein
MQVISDQELAQDPRRVIDGVRRGEPALVGRHGEPEAAILDIVDYRILRAVAHAQAHDLTGVDLEQGLPDDHVEQAADAQARYDLALAYYLAGAISTGRLAAVLRLPFVDVSLRFGRLGVPLRLGPETIGEILDDADVAGRLTSRR